MAKGPLNSGFYVSQDEYLEKGLDATIYRYTLNDNAWRKANHDETLKHSELPATPAEMWPLKLVQR